MKYTIHLHDKDGKTLIYSDKGLTEFPSEAFLFNNSKAASGRAWDILGHGPVFWESERKSAKLAQEKYKGWTFTVVEVSTI